MLADRLTLKRMREDAGISRAQMAAMLGVNVNSIGNYETGYREPSIVQIVRWYSACGYEVRAVKMEVGRDQIEEEAIQAVKDLPTQYQELVLRIARALKKSPQTTAELIVGILEGLIQRAEAQLLRRTGSD